MSESELSTRWHVAVRTAAVASVLAATLAVALASFWHVPAGMLVIATAVVGLAVGVRLPAARPGLVLARRR